MKVLLDENLPATLGPALTAIGFDVRHVSDIAPGATDDVVLATAVREAEVLVTADKDFGALVYLAQRAHMGVVLVRVHPVSAHVDRIARVLSAHQAELAGAFVVVDAHKVRVRRRSNEP